MSGAIERQKISQGLFKSAAAARNPVPLVMRLGEIGVDDQRVTELAGLIRRAGALILQRPNPSDQAARDAFLTALRAALMAAAPELDLGVFDIAVTAIGHAEEGHFRILGALDRCEISKRSIAARLSAAFTRGEQRLAEVSTLIEEALASGAPFSVPGGVALTDENGEPRSPDALATSVVEGLSGLLKMEGYRAGLFTRFGWIELPALPAASKEDLLLYSPCELLGMSWQRWDLLHQKALFFDQPIDLLIGDTLPANCPQQITRVFARPCDANFADWAANERALDREGISYRDLVTTTNVQALAKGISGPVAALPKEWITEAEVTQALALSEAVGFEIAKDVALYAGLRLTEWVRGYCALAAWAETRTKVDDPILRTGRDELVDLLTRLSLTEAQANTFVDTVSFSRGSRDLWDAPIVLRRPSPRAGASSYRAQVRSQKSAPARRRQKILLWQPPQPLPERPRQLSIAIRPARGSATTGHTGTGRVRTAPPR